MPARIRLLVGAVVAVLVLLVAGGTTAVLYGGAAVRWGIGGELSAPASDRVWVGYSVSNDSALPATLHFARTLTADNARVADARVLDLQGGDGVGVVDALDADTAARARPLDGFVLPAGSTSRYQVLLLVERIDPSRDAVLRVADLGYSVLGLDHGARTDGSTTRIRAPRS